MLPSEVTGLRSCAPAMRAVRDADTRPSSNAAINDDVVSPAPSRREISTLSCGPLGASPAICPHVVLFPSAYLTINRAMFSLQSSAFPRELQGYCIQGSRWPLSDFPQRGNV